MPPLPPWSGMHPLLVHFPVALLLTAPILILLAMASGRSWRPLSLAALVVLLLGVAGVALAVASGEAGEDAAKGVPGAKAMLERHEELGELTRNIFLVMGVVFAGIVAAGAWRMGRRGFVMASLLFLVPYAAGAILLIKTAHEGGVLVHGQGVHAPLGPGAPAVGRVGHDDDDD